MPALCEDVMRIGKVKESILKRSVLRQLHNHSEEGSLASGEDAGVLLCRNFQRMPGWHYR